MDRAFPSWLQAVLVLAFGLLLVIGYNRFTGSFVKEGIEKQATLTREATAKAKEADLANVIAVERKQVTVSQETSSAYQKDLAAIDARYRAERVRREAQAYQRGRRDAAVPRLPHSAGRPDEDTQAGLDDPMGPTSVGSLNLDEREEAERMAFQLLRLQEWVTKQAEANAPEPTM